MVNDDQQYALIRYSSKNIGDEIQSIAATRFLPHIDYYVQRERVSEFKRMQQYSGSVKMIMNAYWMFQPQFFPPSDAIEPLFVSIHLKREKLTEFERQDILDYFRRYEPVGCRDLSTLEFMKKHGIDAYFSGCLTSTLIGNPNFKRLHSVDERGDYVLLVDIPTNIENRIKSVSGNVPVYNVSRMLSGAFDPIKRLDVAKCMLALYHNARCVVTSRLHAALPATAFETPVCLVNFEQEDRAGRFDGLMELFNQVDEKDFDSNTVGYDFVNPPANPTVYLKMRENLVSVCKEFTGFDSEKSIFEDSYQPLAVLIGCLKDDRSVMNRFLRYATPNELLSALYDRQINGANRFDV